MQRIAVWTVCVTALLGCSTAVERPEVRPGPSLIQPDTIDIADDGRCFAAVITAAAQFQTVTVQELVIPPTTDEAGNVITPGVYRDVPRQEQVAPRQQSQFETPCPPTFTSEFTASLQRALKVRGLYDGPISGTYDQATGNAVRAFQTSDGLSSPILSIAAARKLGLVALSAEQIEALDIQ